MLQSDVLLTEISHFARGIHHMHLPLARSQFTGNQVFTQFSHYLYLGYNYVTHVIC